MLATHDPVDREPVVDRARFVAPVLVGRKREFDVLASVLSSPPATVALEGEAGIGKTRLVSELARSTVLVGRRWLMGGCRRIHDPFPLGPVLEALRGAAEDIRGLRLSPVAGSLLPLLPELTTVLPAELAPLHDRAAERHRVFRALAELLSCLGPAVLVLEDMHWADEQTLDFIAYLTADPPADLALVLTFRGEEVQPALRAIIAKLPASVRRAELQLRPLDVAQTGALGAAILGASRISDEFAEHLCARASGVPFAVEELLALLQARGSLVHGATGWARRALVELDVPTGIRDPVLERVSRLSETARSVVEAAAVLEMPLPAAELVRVGGVSKQRASDAIDDAVTSGLLTEHRQAISFRHVLAAQAVYEAIPSQRRALLHGRAASLLQAAGHIPSGHLSHHLKRAGRFQEWVIAAEAAADTALALGHDAEAVRLLEELVREAPLDADQPWRVALKLGRACSESGANRPDLADLLAGVLKAAMPRAARGELALWLALVMHHAGADTLRMRPLLMEAVADLEDRPELEALAMVTLGMALPPGVPVPEHRRWLERARETVPSIRDPGRELHLLGAIAMSLAYLGDPQWRSLAEEIVARTGGMPRSRQEASAYVRIAMAGCYIGAQDRSGPLLAAAIEQADADDHALTAERLASTVALLDFCRGSWEGLRERAAALLDEMESLESLDVKVIAGCLALAAGETDEARRRLTDVAQELELTGDRSLLAFVVAALARHAVVSDDFDTAVGIADRFLFSLEEKGLWAPVTRALPAIAQLLISTDQQPRARALLDRLTEELADLDAPLAEAALSHARGFLERALGAPTLAASLFLDAAEEYERLSCPYEAAQAREHGAATLFTADRPAAERELRAALATYRRLGASWDHARCMRLGRQHGLRLAATHRGGRKGYGDELSPRERQVARLAAQGLSNKAIAAELYLSPNTVDKHLGRAMRKLDVRTRAALGMRMAQLPADRDAPAAAER